MFKVNVFAWAVFVGVSVAMVRAQTEGSQPVARTDENSRLAHTQLLDKARRGGIDVYFEGDSITRRWGTSDAAYRAFFDHWTRSFFGWNAANFGWGGATIILMGITPRTDSRGGVSVMPTIDAINGQYERLADGRRIRYVDINAQLARGDGGPREGVTVDGLHLSLAGYQVWADALRPILTEVLGPRAETDHAPPPTGDPRNQESGIRNQESGIRNQESGFRDS